MLAFNVTTALGTSIMAFVLGVLIGVSLGYILWERESPTLDQKIIKEQLKALKKDSSKGRRGPDESKQ